MMAEAASDPDHFDAIAEPTRSAAGSCSGSLPERLIIPTMLADRISALPTMPRGALRRPELRGRVDGCIVCAMRG
jgi:hypothetical protein